MSKIKKAHKPEPNKPAKIPGGNELKTRWVVLILLAVACLAYWPFISSDQMLFGSDTGANIDAQQLSASEMKEGRFPLWTPTRLGGMPTVDAMAGDVFYPARYLSLILPIHRALGYKIVLHVFLAGLFFFLLLNKGFKTSRAVALFGGLLYMLNAEFVSHTYPGHEGKMFVIALLPFVLWMLEELIQRPTFTRSGLLGLGVGLCLLTSHIQMTYFLLWGLFAYVIFRIVFLVRDEKNWKGAARIFGFFWVGIALGLGLGMIQLLAPYMYVKEGFSVRGPEKGFEYAASWSLHPEEVASLWVPEFGNTLGEYWGRNYFKLNTEYVGLVSSLLFVFSLAAFADRAKFFWLGVSLFALLYALGAHTPLFQLCYAIIPGVKSFRGPSMMMFWFALALVLVSAIGLAQFLKQAPAWSNERKERFVRRLLYFTGGILGFCLLLTVAGDAVRSLWRSVLYSDIPADKLQAMSANYPNFVKGLWFWGILAGGSLLALRAFLQNKLGATSLVLLLSAIALVDLYRVNSRFIEIQDPSQYLSPDAAIMQVQRDPEPKRVFDLPGSYNQNYVGIFGLESVVGFHDNELRWYREFRGENSANLVAQLQSGNVDGNPFLNLLNVKYLLYRPGQGRNVEVVPNPGALPRAFVANRYEVVPESLSVQRLKDPAFTYRTTILLVKKPAGLNATTTDSSAPGSAIYKRVAADRFQVQTSAPQASLLFVSEVYYPGWKATVNGKPAEIYQADGALMAVVIPAGTSNIEFAVHSRFLNIGAAISGISVLLLCGVFALSFARKRKLKTGDTQKP